MHAPHRTLQQLLVPCLFDCGKKKDVKHSGIFRHGSNLCSDVSGFKHVTLNVFRTGCLRPIDLQLRLGLHENVFAAHRCYGLKKWKTFWQYCSGCMFAQDL